MSAARRREQRRAPLLWLALAAGLGGCGEGEGAAAPAPGGEPPRPVVEVLRLEPQTFRESAALLGQLEAAESVMVRSEVPGIVETIAFAEGEPVAAGQLLFALRDDEPRARLHEAEADLRLAEDAWRRARDLAAHRVVSPARLEQVSSELAAARARVEVARVALGRTRIRAPFDGLVGARLVSPGARIEEGQDLVRVESIDELDLVFSLPEQVLPLARTGVDIELIVAPYPGERFPGRISFVAPSLNPSTRRLSVKARVPNPDRRLRPGLFARVEADLGAREAALVVPDSAIVYEHEGSFVWRVGAGDAVERVPVELGTRESDRVEVRSGLRAGDVVVVAGMHKLAPGVRVEAVPSAPAPAPASAAPGGEQGAPPDGGAAAPAREAAIAPGDAPG